jgi:hypothetical protein
MYEHQMMLFDWARWLYPRIMLIVARGHCVCRTRPVFAALSKQKEARYTSRIILASIGSVDELNGSIAESYGLHKLQLDNRVASW